MSARCKLGSGSSSLVMPDCPQTFTVRMARACQPLGSVQEPWILMRENDRYGVRLRRPKVERVFVVSSTESRHRE
jgi:hypothetical protein